MYGRLKDLLWRGVVTLRTYEELWKNVGILAFTLRLSHYSLDGCPFLGNMVPVDLEKKYGNFGRFCLNKRMDIVQYVFDPLALTYGKVNWFGAPG